MSKIWAVDITIHGTAYVRAESAEEAKEKVNNSSGEIGELPNGEYCDWTISGACFDDPALPDVSLSPIMTVPKNAAGDGIDCVHED